MSFWGQAKPAVQRQMVAGTYLLPNFMFANAVVSRRVSAQQRSFRFPSVPFYILARSCLGYFSFPCGRSGRSVEGSGSRLSRFSSDGGRERREAINCRGCMSLLGMY